MKENAILCTAMGKVRCITIQNCFIMGCAHLLQEEFEAPLTHVLALVLVLAKPCEGELADARAHTVYKLSEVRCFGVAMNLAPSVCMAHHVELVTDVMHTRWCQASSCLRTRRASFTKLVHVACIIVNDGSDLWVKANKLGDKQIPLAQRLGPKHFTQRCDDTTRQASTQQSSCPGATPLPQGLQPLIFPTRFPVAPLA